MPLLRGDSASAQRVVREVLAAAESRLATEHNLAMANLTASPTAQTRALETDILHTWTQYHVDVPATIHDVPVDPTWTGLNALIASAQASIREAGALHLRALAALGSSEAR